MFPRLFSPSATSRPDDKEPPISPEEYERVFLELTTNNSLEQLLKQPAILEEQRRQIRQEMESLAFNNYPIFLQTASCVTEVHSQMRSAVDKLDSLVSTLPELSTAAQDFTKRTAAINKTRQQYVRTLKQHPNLLEILELPQLMGTCVRNFHYDEALDLEQFARRLMTQHADIPLVRDVMEDVQRATLAMQSQLQHQLSGNIQLSTALRVIGYLKRLTVFGDRELRVVFLQCRTSYLSELLSQIPNANAYIYLSKLVETTRSQIFDIITQYRAIFSMAEEHQTPSNGSTDDDASSDPAPNPDREDGGILFGWIVQRISDFIARMEKSLAELSDGSSLSNILNQCMYFGLSLGRIGVDFRSLLPPMFERALFNLYKHNIIQAHQSFTSQLKKYKLFPIQQTMILPPSSSSSSATSTPSKSSNVDTLSPPISLLDFPPAAALCNGVLTALNELRKCCPQSLQFNVARHFESIMTTIIQQLRVFARETPLTPEERTAVQELSRVICDDLVPFLVKCFDALFKSSRRLISQEKLQTMMVDLFERRAVQNAVSDLLKATADEKPLSEQLKAPTTAPAETEVAAEAPPATPESPAQ